MTTSTSKPGIGQADRGITGLDHDPELLRIICEAEVERMAMTGQVRRVDHRVHPPHRHGGVEAHRAPRLAEAPLRPPCTQRMNDGFESPTSVGEHSQRLPRHSTTPDASS